MRGAGDFAAPPCISRRAPHEAPAVQKQKQYSIFGWELIELKHKHSNAAVNSSMIRRPIRRWFPLFMGPMVCAFIIGFVYPFCKGIYLSFCKFKVTSDAHFVGLENYRRAFQDASFVHSFWFTALFAVISLVLINVLAFAVAYALTQGIKGSNLYRTVFFMPNLIGGIVLGYIWSMIFDGFLVKYNTSVVLNSEPSASGVSSSLYAGSRSAICDHLLADSSPSRRTCSRRPALIAPTTGRRSGRSLFRT